MQQLIAYHINSQIKRLNNVDRLVDVVRSVVFTSTRSDTPMDGARATMITDFHAANFEVHRLVTSGTEIKKHQHLMALHFYVFHHVWGLLIFSVRRSSIYNAAD